MGDYTYIRLRSETVVKLIDLLRLVISILRALYVTTGNKKHYELIKELSAVIENLRTSAAYYD